jgi:hypothetical protein
MEGAFYTGSVSIHTHVSTPQSVPAFSTPCIQHGTQIQSRSSYPQIKPVMAIFNDESGQQIVRMPTTLTEVVERSRPNENKRKGDGTVGCLLCLWVGTHPSKILGNINHTQTCMLTHSHSLHTLSKIDTTQIVKRGLLLTIFRLNRFCKDVKG